MSLKVLNRRSFTPSALCCFPAICYAPCCAGQTVLCTKSTFVIRLELWGILCRSKARSYLHIIRILRAVEGLYCYVAVHATLGRACVLSHEPGVGALTRVAQHLLSCVLPASQKSFTSGVLDSSPLPPNLCAVCLVSEIGPPVHHQSMHSY